MNVAENSLNASALLARIEARTAIVGVIGLGYVGLPLAAAAARTGFSVIGFDIDATKIEHISAGRSYIGSVTDAGLAKLVKEERLCATATPDRLEECDVIVICVPTPLTTHREPDMQFIESTARIIVPRLRPERLVVLESTTYPGTTTDFLVPILETSGLKSGRDFFTGFSPEREDPGNVSYHTANIPKVVSGEGADALALTTAFYAAIVKEVVPVSSTAVAEATKLTENIFRSVNIALVNELKMVYREMGIDIWEVIEAAKTKPFGFMPFYPGPGLGGHCIPIDPFYLAWRAREFERPARFIELAGEINTWMPRYVIGIVTETLNKRARLALSCARILILGLAYKKNVSDIRESPSLRLIELLEEGGAQADFSDPHVDIIPLTREHSRLAGRRSLRLSGDMLSGYDLVLLATDHDAFDYALIAENARLIVDSRNAFERAGRAAAHIIKA